MRFWILGFLWVGCSVFAKGETHFSIIICSYKNAAFCEWNIKSCINQHYDNFHVYFVNDHSPDNTLELVVRMIHEQGKEAITTVIDNEVRKESALANQDYVIRNLVPKDSVCVIVDGDDALADLDVLSYLDRLYQTKDIWATLGGVLWRNSLRIDKWKAPDLIYEYNTFRHFIRGPLHLRTFYAFLYREIAIEDLQEEGEFVKYASDLPLFFPIMEMAGRRLYFPEKILYIYNDENPISEYNRSGVVQRQLEVVTRYLLARKYEPLECRPL